MKPENRGSIAPTRGRIAAMRLFFAFLLTCTLTRADALNDLKTVLAKAGAHEPIQALVTLEVSRQASGEKDGPPGKVSLKAQDGPDGLVLFWGRANMDRVADEVAAREKDKSKPAPTRSAMNSLNATTVDDLLNAAPALLRALEHASLVSETPTEWQGKPARLLTLKIAPELSEKDKKYVKELAVVAKIWVGADGWPLAAERTEDMKGRAMLVISFEQHEKEEFRFARAGGRLVTVYHAKESSGSGAGETGREHEVTTIEIDNS